MIVLEFLGLMVLSCVLGVAVFVFLSFVNAFIGALCGEPFR